MFAGAFFADFLVTRVLVLMLIALLKYCKGCAKGYRKLKYKSEKDIKNILGEAIKSMFDHKKVLKEKREQRHNKSHDEMSNLGNSRGN
jgi:hypothetical protein